MMRPPDKRNGPEPGRHQAGAENIEASNLCVHHNTDRHFCSNCKAPMRDAPRWMKFCANCYDYLLIRRGLQRNMQRLARIARRDGA